MKKLVSSETIALHGLALALPSCSFFRVFTNLSPLSPPPNSSFHLVKRLACGSALALGGPPVRTFTVLLA